MLDQMGFNRSEPKNTTLTKEQQKNRPEMRAAVGLEFNNRSKRLSRFVIFSPKTSFCFQSVLYLIHFFVLCYQHLVIYWFESSYTPAKVKPFESPGKAGGYLF
jgi:hypothetical protein